MKAMDWLYELVVAMAKYPLKTVQLIFIVLGPLAYAIVTYFHFKSLGDVVLVRVAHFGAAGVIVALPVVICSFLRGFLAVLDKTIIFRLISFDLDAHKLAALEVFAYGMVHTIAWGIFELPTYTQIYGITGWIMNALMVVPLIFVMPYFRNYFNGFNRQYLSPHKLASVFFLIAFLVHIPVKTAPLPPVITLFIEGGVLLGVLMFDRLLLVAFCLHKTSTTDRTMVLDGNTFRLSLRRPKGFKYGAGYYAYISIPGIRFFESHPFSICSGEKEDVVEFVIRVAGPWTRAVYSAINHGKLDHSIYLRGSFPEKTIVGAMKEKELAFISTGVGLTPFLSMMKTIKQRDREEVSIVGHVSSRSESDFRLIFEAVRVAESEGIPVSIFVYYTGSHANKSEIIESMTRQYGWSFTHVEKKAVRTRSKQFRGKDTDAVASVVQTKAHALGSCFLDEDDDQPLEIFEAEAEAIQERSRTMSVRKAWANTLDVSQMSSSMPLPSENGDDILGRNRKNTPKIDMQIIDDNTQEERIFPDVKVGDSVASDGEKGPGSGFVDVFFHDNRMDMSDVLGSSDGSFYFVGPGPIASFLNTQCARYGRKLFFTTWS